MMIDPLNRTLAMVLAVALSALPLASGQNEGPPWDVPLTVEADGWKRYTNPRFGCSIPVPPGMVPRQPPENGAGQGFMTPDGKVRLLVWGSFNVDGQGDLDKKWAEELADTRMTITYKRKAKSWFVISGVTHDGTGFYMRYDANKNFCAGWEIAHPQAEENRYVPWIERIAKGYQARLGQGQEAVNGAGN
jgi:hypothetical protein